MDNKYKDIMSHIEVTDDMRNRILQNIAEEVDSAPKGRVDSSLLKRRAKVSTIIGVVAACGIVLAAGGFLLSMISRSSSTEKAADATVALKNNDSSTDGLSYYLSNGAVPEADEQTVGAAEQKDLNRTCMTEPL